MSYTPYALPLTVLHTPPDHDAWRKASVGVLALISRCGAGIRQGPRRFCAILLDTNTLS